MATKVYGISGRVSVEIKIPVGKAVLPLNFERGCLDRKNYRPATYSTSDKSIQDMIEGSSYFGKTIKLYKTYGSTQPKTGTSGNIRAEAKPVSKEESAKEAATKEYADVTTAEQARVVLKGLGAKAVQLKDANAIRKAMSVFGVTFPNYTE